MTDYTAELRLHWNGALVTVTVRSDDLHKTLRETGAALRMLKQRGAGEVEQPVSMGRSTAHDVEAALRAALSELDKLDTAAEAMMTRLGRGSGGGQQCEGHS